MKDYFNMTFIPKIKHLFLYPLILMLALLSLHCEKKQQIFPVYTYPGYKTKLVFEDNFTTESSNWFVEGAGNVYVSETNQLAVSTQSPDTGIALWTVDNFSGNFQIEYELTIHPNATLNLVFLCADGVLNDNIITDHATRSGNRTEYSNGNIRGYQIAYHAYSSDGIHHSKSTIRKIPGQLLLSQTDKDPCIENRTYLIDIIKISNRILLIIDGITIHDVRDKGGFGTVHKEGKIGFWFSGLKNDQVASIDHVHIFDLIPE